MTPLPLAHRGNAPPKVGVRSSARGLVHANGPREGAGRVSSDSDGR